MRMTLSHKTTHPIGSGHNNAIQQFTVGVVIDRAGDFLGLSLECDFVQHGKRDTTYHNTASLLHKACQLHEVQTNTQISGAI